MWGSSCILYLLANHLYFCRYSRYANPISISHEFSDIMPNSILDGEIWYTINVCTITIHNYYSVAKGDVPVPLRRGTSLGTWDVPWNMSPFGTWDVSETWDVPIFTWYIPIVGWDTTKKWGCLISHGAPTSHGDFSFPVGRPRPKGRPVFQGTEKKRGDIPYRAIEVTNTPY